MDQLPKPRMRLPRLHVALSLLLLSGCSSADLCEPGDPCVGFGYTNYRRVLNRVCNAACDQLAECGETLAIDPGDDCEDACRNEATQEYYWTCEPRFRVFLDCIRQQNDCDPSACEAESDAFNSCRIKQLPANANSCVLANNGVCDEPDGCVAGSDTTDCADAQ